MIMNKLIRGFIIVLVITFIIVSIFYVVKILDNSSEEIDNVSTLKEEKEDQLVTYGFTEDESNLIKSKLSDDNIKLIINNKYDKSLVLGLINNDYYIDSNLQRYFNYSNNNSDMKNNDIIKNVNSNIDNEFYNYDIQSDTSKGILMIANKFYKLGSDFAGYDLVDVPAKYSQYNTSFKLNKEAYEHFVEMWNDANAVGLDFRVYSGYRSYDLQTKLYNNYVNRDGKEEADTYSARAGHSEHQTGLAVDLKSRTMNTDYFEKTDEFAWLQDNAHKYGFILRYNLGQEYLTGYMYEPWHYRYCGVECATYIYEHKINFEEYYEYFVKNK